MIIGLAVIFGPALILIAAAVLGAGRDDSRLGLAAAALAGVLAWLGYAAAVPHTQGGPTVFGAHPHFADNETLVWLPISAWLVVAAVAGWRRVAAPFTIAAAIVGGPLVLAWWTTPRGDNDGLWTLIFFFIPILGAMCGVVAAVAIGISARGETTPRLDKTTSRVAALVADAVLFVAAAFVPIRALSDTSGGAAFAITVVCAVGYLGSTVAARGATLGHRLLGLRVTAASGGRPSGAQAFARGAVIVAELVFAPVLVGLTLVGDLIAVASRDKSLADVLCRTRVVWHTEATV